MLVAAVAVRRERALVAGQRLVQLSLDVGDDAEVLLHAGPQLPARPTQLQRAQERLHRVLQRPARDVQTAQRVQRLRREHVVSDPVRHVVTALAQLPRQRRLVAMAAQDRQPPQRFGQHRRVAAVLGGRDGFLVPVDRLGHTPRALALAGSLEHVAGA